MNYTEAIQYKKESIQNASDDVLKLYHIVIAPANTDESQKYIDDYLKNPESFNDESCKKYSSKDDYEVMSFKKENAE